MVNKTLKKLEVPFGLAGTSIVSNLIGSSIGGKLPPGTINPLTSIGTSAGKAAGVAGTIAFLGIALEETSKLNPSRKNKKFKVPNVQLVRDYGRKTPL